MLGNRLTIDSGSCLFQLKVCSVVLLSRWNLRNHLLLVVIGCEDFTNIIRRDLFSASRDSICKKMMEREEAGSS